MTREGRAETREAKRTEQTNQESKSGKAAGFSSTSQKGNIVHGKLKSQKELKKITGSEDYKKSDYEGKTKMLNVATANKGMSVKQKKLAAKAPPPNKLDEKDFAVLRAEKAKGRGMGLQDEKVKPGKVMKANLGLMFMKKAKDKGAKGAEFLSPIAMAKRMFNKKSGGVIKAKRGVFSSGKISDMSFDEKMKRVESGQINKKTGKFTSMNAMRDAKGFQKGESAAEFNKRRMKLTGAKKALSATRIGKIVLPIAAAGVAAQQYLKGKMKKDKNKKTLKDFREQKKPGIPSEKTKTINSALNKLNKKMGGGMMQKPMGYKHGTKPGAGPLAGLGRAAGRPASRSQQQNKKERPDLVIMMPVKEGPAKQNTTIKTFKIKNRMGGGMMQKPMGYSKGVSVKARGCKLGRTRPTKIT